MNAVRMKTSYIPGEAKGAIRNGRPIVKVMSDVGDRNPVGTRGIVLASHEVPAEAIAELRAKGIEPDGPGDRFVYFIVWETLPGIPVGVRGGKIREFDA